MRPGPLAIALVLVSTTAFAGPPGPATTLAIDPRVRLVARGVLPEPYMSRQGALPLTVALPGGAPALLRAGFPARALSPGVAAVALPAAALPRLLALPGLLAVEPARRLRPLLDQSVPLTGASVARAELGLDGSGVLLAVIDTGLDLRHGDFRRADGRTRVRWLLDAAAPRGSLHPELPDYGGMAVYSGADIDAVLDAEARGQPPPLALTEKDQRGHGTHVTGIAAGSGLATGRGRPAGRYVGVAPGADLCIVQASRSDGTDFEDDAVVIGARFCLDRAADAGQPVVVNLSLGALGGPHDGTTAIERALDELFPEGAVGRALVAAAGNGGFRDWHAGGFLLSGERDIGLRVTAGSGRAGKAGSQLALDLYFDGDLSLSVTSPRGVTVGPVAPGGSARGEAAGEGRVTVEGAAGPGARRSAAVLLLGLEGKAVGAGDWRLTLSGEARRFDVWFTDGSDDVALQLLRSLDPDTQIDLPATARSAISVGSFTSRTEWLRADGMMATRSREERLAASQFSGAGPTADGRFAPDLAAPGEFVLSALAITAPPTDPRSSFFFAQDPGFLLADDGVHGALRGTSQAAPHVAGAAALLFQLDRRGAGALTAGRLRELLRTTAEGPGYGPRLGFGRLDVARAARLLAGRRPGALDPARCQVGVSRDLVPPGEEVTVTVAPRDGDGLPLGPGQAVAIEASAGAFTGPVRDLGGGRYERTLLGGERGAIAEITASIGGVPVGRTLRVAFAGDRSELGAPPQAGGCAVGGAPAGPGGAALLLLLLVLPFRRRRRAAAETT